MNRLLLGIIITLIPLTFVNAANSLNDELSICASMNRDLQRLACYDKLAGLASSSPVEALSEKSKTSLDETNSNDVSSTKENSSAATKTVTNTSASTGSFGLFNKDNEPDSVTSSIPGEFKGWKNGDKIKLANGQIWQIKDSSATLYHKASNPKVTVYKGMFGSFRMKIDDLNKSVSVKRVK